MGEARITAVVVGVWSFACAGRLTGLILRADGTDSPLIISPPFRQYSVRCGFSCNGWNFNTHVRIFGTSGVEVNDIC